MSFAAFARTRAVSIGIGVASIAAVCCIMALSGSTLHAVVLAAVFLALAGAAALAIDYARRRRFLNQISQADGLEHAWQLPAIIDEPTLADQAFVYETMRDMQRSASADIERERAHAEEYREYVESWIHEVKAPLAAAQLAAERAGGEDAQRLRSELDRVERQVEQALWYARSTAVASDYSIREVGLRTLVNGVCRKNARLLIDCGVAPSIDIPDEATVFADEKWAAFVVTQAVVNAAKYGARTLHFTSETHALPDAGEVVKLCIADDGPGIPAADVPRVFDRGFTGENGRAQGSSTGMGLYLAAVMCAKMGLGIEIASEQGAGTRVIITFPQDRRRLDYLASTGR